MGDEALKVKISAMRGKLMTRNDYVNMSRLVSVDAVGSAIRSREGYGEALSGLSAAALRRTPLERRVIFSITADYIDIYRFVTDHMTRRMMDNLFMKYEIRVIRTLLGYIFDERPTDFEPDELSRETGRVLNLKLSLLLKAKTVPELIAALGGTVYYSVLAQVYRENISLFELETQLDLFYYLRLWNAVKKYPVKTEKKALEFIIGAEIDLKNIMRAYRFKRYGTPPDKTYAHLIPAAYKTDMPELKKITDSDFELPAKNYKNVFAAGGGLENCCRKKMSELCGKTLSDNKISSARVFAYLYLKELETNNLTSLIEGVRYRLAPGDILSRLTV